MSNQVFWCCLRRQEPRWTAWGLPFSVPGRVFKATPDEFIAPSVVLARRRHLTVTQAGGTCRMLLGCNGLVTEIRPFCWDTQATITLQTLPLKNQEQLQIHFMLNATSRQ
jgi:hypothetical protein